MNEPLQSTLPGLLAAVAPQVQLLPGQAYALFGHSLGALVAFELALHLMQQAVPQPLQVFVTGTDAPSCRDSGRFAHLQTDAELRAELVRLQGTPACVLEDAELMALTLPILRADFQVAGSYVCARERRIQAPLHVVGGADDTTTLETLRAWSEHTCGEFELSMLPGGHFFLQSQEAELLQLVEQRLRGRLAELDRARELGSRGNGAQSGSPQKGSQPGSVARRSQNAVPGVE
ncbi:MAG: hypothetical protein RL685_538 [Pseudomonadota bacterium]